MAASPDFAPLVCEETGTGESPPSRGADSRPARKIAGGCAIAAVLGLVLCFARDRHVTHGDVGIADPGDVAGLSEVFHNLNLDRRRCTENGEQDADCCAEEGAGGCMEGLEYHAGGTCAHGCVSTQCSSGAASPEACTERTRLDFDCCALPGDGGCEPGYTYRPGRQCSDARAVFTVCVRDPAIKVQRERSSGPKSKTAFSVVLYGNETGELMLVRVLARSLHTAALRVGAQPSDFVVLIPTDDYMLRYRDLLEDDGLIVKEVQRIPLPDNVNTKERWAGVMDKLNAWTLTEYEAVAQLDNDMLFAGAEGGVDPEDVFRQCGLADLCVTLDFVKRRAIYGLELQAGILVLKPSMSTFEALREAAARDHHKYRYPEQQFLSNYFEDPKNHKAMSNLEPTWNSCSLNGEPSRAALLHFCGPIKPTVQPITFDSVVARSQDHRLKSGYVLWYKQLNMLDACTAKSSEEDCERGCHWCANCGYCIHKEVECSDKLFRKWEGIAKVQ